MSRSAAWHMYPYQHDPPICNIQRQLQLGRRRQLQFRDPRATPIQLTTASAGRRRKETTSHERDPHHPGSSFCPISAHLPVGFLARRRAFTSASTTPSPITPSSPAESSTNPTMASSESETPRPKGSEERLNAWRSTLAVRRGQLTEEAERQMTILGLKINEVTGYKEVERLKDRVHERGEFKSTAKADSHPRG